MRDTANDVISEDVQQLCLHYGDLLAPLSGSSLLVTGGCGFLCSYFVECVAFANEHLWEAPCDVAVVDNLASGVVDRLAHLIDRPDIRFIEHDVARPLDDSIAPDWIIHGASIASPVFYRRHPLETIEANVNGTHNLIRFARDRSSKGLLYLSTSEIYGDPSPDQIPTSENYWGNVSCTGPRASYDESKRLAETICSTYVRLEGLPIRVARPFNVYGPGQRLDDRRIVPDMMRAAVEKTPIVLYSDGRATRSFCYIADAIGAMWHVLLNGEPGDIFNVGNDTTEVSIEAAATLVARLVDPPLEIRFETNPDPDYLTDNPQRRCPDLTRLRDRFGWEPRYGLEEGFERTLRSYGGG